MISVTACSLCTPESVPSATQAVLDGDPFPAAPRGTLGEQRELPFSGTYYFSISSRCSSRGGFSLRLQQQLTGNEALRDHPSPRSSLPLNVKLPSGASLVSRDGVSIPCRLFGGWRLETRWGEEENGTFLVIEHFGFFYSAVYTMVFT